MTHDEARKLLFIIVGEDCKAHVDIHRIGNGEYVVLLDRHFCIWSEKDWQQHKSDWVQNYGKEINS